MEGVMMRNKDLYAVAVRKPDNEIAVETSSRKDFSDRVKLFKLPIFRGMLAFIDSMVIGVKVLNYSASFFDDEDETRAGKKNKKAVTADKDFIVEEVGVSPGDDGKAKPAADKSNALLMALAVLMSIVLSVALFMVLPVILTNFFSRFITSRYLILFIEGVVRLGIFIGYVVLASRMNEIKRVFMYHGAEHKTINCLENGFELTVENVRWQSKQHKRCGTSFMLLVILISLVFFLFLPVNNLIWKVISRILLVPFIAGVSYEFIRLAGKSENKVVHILSQPGLWMQALTTKEPDDSMIEVAIQSVSAVYDWKAFLGSNGGKSTDKQRAAAKQNTSGRNANTKQTNAKQSVAKQSVAKQNNAKQNNIKKNDAKLNDAKLNDAKQNDTKQNDIKKNDAKQNNIKQTNAKPNDTKQNSTKQNGAKQNNTKQNDIKQNNTILNDIKDNPQNDSGRQSTNKQGEKKPSVREQKQADNRPNPVADGNKAVLDIKPQIGGLAYSGKVEGNSSSAVNPNAPKRNKGAAPVTLKPNLPAATEEDDDDILKALDRYFDGDHKKQA